MLILTRKPGQSLTIRPARDLDPATSVGTLFDAGPLEVTVQRLHGRQVKLGISAPDGLLILRAELDVFDAEPKPEPAVLTR